MAAERPRRAARGVALVEVLIALLIFMVGVLGIVGLQARAVQFSVQAEDRSRAALLANELVASMWQHKSAALPEDELQAWQGRVAAALPEGRGAIDDAADGVVSVSIEWHAPGTPRRDSAEAQPHRYRTKVVLP